MNRSLPFLLIFLLFLFFLSPVFAENLNLTFEDDSDLANWGLYGEPNKYTTKEFDPTGGVDGSGALKLGDAGYDLIMKRKFYASPGKMFNFSVDVKTEGWGQPDTYKLYIELEGVYSDPVQVNSDGVFTTFTLSGVAQADSGYIRVYGTNTAGQNYVWLDNIVYEEQVVITPIADIQTPVDPNVSDASPLVDSTVTTQGIVMGVSKYGYFIQDAAQAWHGLYVYCGDVDSLKPAVGDEIQITGTVSEYYGLTELATSEKPVILSSGNSLYEPVEITAAEFDEPYEAVVVQVNDVKCTNPDLGYGEWQVMDNTGQLVVDDLFYKFTPTKGAHYNISGITYYSYGAYKLEPRDSTEITDLGITPIAMIQTPEDPETSDASPYVDSTVTVQGIVSGVSKYGYFMQDDIGAWNGLYVYCGNVDSLKPAVGDEIKITGTVAEYNGLTELATSEKPVVVSSGNSPYDPVEITVAEFNEPYEGVVVTVKNVTCINPDLGYGEWLVTDGVDSMVIDDLLYPFVPTLDAQYDISGIGYYSYGNYKLEPRDSSDVIEHMPVVTLPLIEKFTDGNFDLDWQINSYLKGDGDTLYIADSTGSAWNSHVGVFEDQSYTGILQVKDAVLEDYTISADIFLYGDPNPDAPLYTGLAIKAKDDELKYYRLVYRNSSSSENGIIKLQGYDGSWHISKKWVPGTDFPTIETGWHNLKVTVKGYKFWVYLDGQELPGCPIEDTDQVLSTGYPGIFKYNTGFGQVLFDNFMVTEPQSTLRPYDIVINEINYNCIGTDTTEFIELYNNDNTTVDLSGYYFSAGITFTFPDSAMLAPGEYAVITIDTTAFRKAYGFSTPYQFEGGLSNGGEEVVFKNPLGTTIDSVKYDDRDPWPKEADGDGPTLSLKSPELDNSLPENWLPSLQNGGTPGALNFPPNNPPSAFHLISPADSTVFTKADFPSDTSTFTVCWTAAMDSDPGDSLHYVMTVLDEAKNFMFDTTFASSDTCHQILPPDSSGNFYWFVKAVDMAGAFSVSDTFLIVFDFETNIAKEDLMPGKFELAQNYPNPFNPTTTIQFKIPIKSDVKLYIYNALGQRVKTLVDKPMTPGTYKVVWDGKNEAGRQVSSGIYFYELRAKNFQKVQKMILMK